MCAISGIIGKNLKDINHRKILNSLKHRGPDASKFIKLDGAVLMHNRLSIIDINNRSDQPLYSEDNSSVIVFNGEIYNYLELREELKNFYHFATQSDTEVILAAYKKWGFHMLDKLFGAFAFCLYDKKKKEAFFARDRFGQKPIFFWKKNNNIYFASEIKGLIAAGYRPKENLHLWSKYLMNGETDNYNNTFFKDVFQLLPGEYSLYRDDNLIVKKWYSLSDRIEKNNEDIDFDRAKEKILELLCSSIAITSRSDAKISLSLSGGLDSNLLLSLLKKLKLIKSNFKCYSVYFGKNFSEKKLINDSLGFLRMKTNYINFELEDLFKTIEPVIKSLESPSGGLMNCALYKLTKNAAKDKFKVILDGTGLDEAFGGYEKHHLMYLNDLKRKKSNQFFKNLELFKKNYNIKEELIYKKLSNLESKSTLTIDGYNLTKNIISQDLFSYYKNDNVDFNDNINLKKSLIDYIQNTKIPRNNRLKDRTSMANSVELRLPFLEHQLIEYALSLPDSFYFAFGRSKSILRESVKGLMSDKVRLSNKISIQSPQNQWMKSKRFISYIEDIINSQKFKNRGLFSVSKIKNELKRFLTSSNQTSFFLWQIINTEKWFDEFIDKD